MSNRRFKHPKHFGIDPTPEAIEEFLLDNRIVTEDGCWIYPLAVGGNGYGYVRIAGINEMVHRLAAYIWLDYKMASRLQINHKRFCKSRLCFNPQHLYVGNKSQNLLDCYAIGSR